MTTSYVTGTVSVTAGSDMVTGTGTGWLSANVAPGFFGLDSADGNPVPVAEIISDTSLRLFTPWRGATAAGQAYWLSYDTRDGQQTVNNAQRLAEYIARLNNVFFSAIGSLTPIANSFLTFDALGAAVLSPLTTAGRALLGVTGAADVVPYFTSEIAASTTPLTSVGRDVIGSASRIQLMSRIGPVHGGEPSVPSASGVGLSDGDFNTVNVGGVYNIAGNWINGPSGSASAGYAGVLQVFQRNSAQSFQIMRFASSDSDEAYIRFSAAASSSSWPNPWKRFGAASVGTVFNRAGMPAGAIIERGSNANGDYVKFADGTQICNSPTFTFSINITSGAIYRADTQVWTFPVAFAGSYAVCSGLQNNANSHWGAAGGGLSSSTNVCALSSSSVAGRNVNFIAIGRWY